MTMRHTPIRKLTIAAAIAAAGLATSAAAQDAAPKVKSSSSTTIIKSGDNQSYEIKIENGEIVTFKLNGKPVENDQYKLDEEGGFIVLKDDDGEPIVIDIPHFDTQEFPVGFQGGIAEWPPRPAVARAPKPDKIEWFDGPGEPREPAAIAWAGQEPPKVMVGIKHDEVSKETREKLGLNEGEGIYIVGVIDNLPADKAGIKTGDVIIEVEGKHMHDRGVLLEVLKKHEPGDNLTVIILRDGEKKKLKLELAPFSADRLGTPQALAVRPDRPTKFNIRINEDDMNFDEREFFENFEPFGEFEFDFDMEGLPPEAKKELEKALIQARKQANEARTRAFTLRRDAQGQNHLHELKIREHQENMHEHADRLREHSHAQAEEMRRLEERLAKLRELGENDRLFRSGPEGRAFIIERDDLARQRDEKLRQKESNELFERFADVQRERDVLASRNRDLENRVDQLERKLEELMKRLEKNESDRRR